MTDGNSTGVLQGQRNWCNYNALFDNTLGPLDPPPPLIQLLSKVQLLLLIKERSCLLNCQLFFSLIQKSSKNIQIIKCLFTYLMLVELILVL